MCRYKVKCNFEVEVQSKAHAELNSRRVVCAFRLRVRRRATV